MRRYLFFFFFFFFLLRPFINYFSEFYFFLNKFPSFSDKIPQAGSLNYDE